MCYVHILMCYVHILLCNVHIPSELSSSSLLTSSIPTTVSLGMKSPPLNVRLMQGCLPSRISMKGYKNKPTHGRKNGTTAWQLPNITQPSSSVYAQHKISKIVMQCDVLVDTGGKWRHLICCSTNKSNLGDLPVTVHGTTSPRTGFALPICHFANDKFYPDMYNKNPGGKIFGRLLISWWCCHL